MTEAELGKRTGVSKRHLSTIRKESLTLKIDFEKKGREIVYSPEGVEKMQAILAAGRSPDRTGEEIPPVVDEIASESIKAACEQKESDSVTLIVTKCPANRRIVFARVEGGDESVRCKVTDNSKFTVGMEIAGCLHIRGDYYEFSGRPPRSKGNWRTRTNNK